MQMFYVYVSVVFGEGQEEAYDDFYVKKSKVAGKSVNYIKKLG